MAGFSWSEFAHDALGLAPLILQFTPLAPIAPFISSGITTAENAGAAAAAGGSPMSGQDKLALAISEVQNLIGAANAQAGRPVIDANLSADLLAAGISAVVDIIKIKQLMTATVTSTIVVPPTPTSGTGSAPAKQT